MMLSDRLLPIQTEWMCVCNICVCVCVPLYRGRDAIEVVTQIGLEF